MESEKIVQGTIFNIQRFSIHDGPGIRTLVFMKGCPLRCRWCSNPEGLSSGISVLSNTRLCISCGFCSRSCQYDAIYIQPDGRYQIDRDKCRNCFRCARVCPSNSKSISGEVKTVAEIVAIVEKDSLFYKHSGGGITIGGGEMLAQPEFSFEILRQCREKGLSTAVETSGYGSLTWLLKIAEQCETVHFDIKAVDSQLHKKLTGTDNGLILENIKALSKHLNKRKDFRPELIIRLPFINGYNTQPGAVSGIVDFIKTQIEYYTLIEVLPFHNFGEKKYEEMGLTYEFTDDPNSTARDLEEPVRILSEAGLRLKVPKW